MSVPLDSYEKGILEEWSNWHWYPVAIFQTTPTFAPEMECLAGYPYCLPEKRASDEHTPHNQSQSPGTSSSTISSSTTEAPHPATPVGEHPPPTALAQKRREQNRASQRAYRKRRDLHLQELECEASEWRAKLDLVSRQCDEQCEQIASLEKLVKQLEAALITGRCCLDHEGPSMAAGWDTFDLVPYHTTVQRPVSGGDAWCVEIWALLTSFGWWSGDGCIKVPWFCVIVFRVCGISCWWKGKAVLVGPKTEVMCSLPRNLMG